MSIVIDQVTTAKTFDEWRQITNNLVSFAGQSFTLDSNNVASNIGLTGDFTFGSNTNTLKVPTIAPLDGQTTVNFSGILNASDSIAVNKASGEGKLQFKLASSDTWKIATNSGHTTVGFSDGTNHLTVSTTAITSNLKISNGMMPASVTLDDDLTVTGGTLTANAVTISGGTINNTIIGSTTAAAGNFTTVDIDGGSIDNTVIGGTTATTAAFSTVTASGLITANGGVQGDVTGNVTGNTSGTAGGLTQAGIDAVLNAVYPVGCLYTTTSTSNPYTILGVGSGTQSWERFAEGRALKGFDPGIGISSHSDTVWETTTDNLDGTTTGTLQGPGSGGNPIKIYRAAAELTLSANHSFKVGEYVSVNNIQSHASPTITKALEGDNYIEGDWGTTNGSLGRYLVVQVPASNKIEIYPRPINTNSLSGQYANVSTYGASQDTSNNAQGGEDSASINIDNLPSHDHAYDNTDATDAQQGMYNRVTTMSGFLTTGKATDYTSGEMNVFVGAVMKKTGNNLPMPIDPKFALCSIWKRVS